MYQERILLTVKDILDKEFKIDTKGYRPQEVDKFLDLVIRDYEEMMVVMKEFEAEKKFLLEDNIKLKQEIRALKTKIDILKDTTGSDNGNTVDVLKRLSNLEKIIYGREE